MIEMTLVGMYAETSPACVSMIGRAVSEPLPNLLPDPGGAFQQPAVKVEHVAGIRFAARRPLQHQRHLPVGDGVFGQIVVDDQRVHAVVHEPFADGGAGKRREVLAGRRVRGRRRQDDRVRHRAGLVEDGDQPGDRRLLLTDRDVDAVERPEVLVAPCLRLAVQPRLADDRVDADRRLARRAIADDQLALTAADRNHRVDRHDAGLHRLADRPAPHDAGRDFLDRVGGVAGDRPFSVDRLAEHVHDAAEQSLADRHLQQLAGRADLVALLQRRVVAEDDDADVGFLEAQRQAGDAVAEVEHLVEHDVAETFDTGDAVADLANDADAPFDGGGLGAADLRFDFLEQAGHMSPQPSTTDPPESSCQRRQTALDASVVDVAPGPEPHASDQARVFHERRHRALPVQPRQGRFDLGADVRGQGQGARDFGAVTCRDRV